MLEKVRSSKEFWSGGMQFAAEVEMSNCGGGDNGYPTRIVLRSDCSGNYFDVLNTDENTLQHTPTVEISICGEWESEKFGDMFIWIGEELNRIKSELFQQIS